MNRLAQLPWTHWEGPIPPTRGFFGQIHRRARIEIFPRITDLASRLRVQRYYAEVQLDNPSPSHEWESAANTAWWATPETALAMLPAACTNGLRTALQEAGAFPTP